MGYRIHISFTLFFLVVFNVNSQPSQEKLLPSALLLKDLEFMKSSLWALHPGVGRFNKIAEFDSAYTSAYSNIKKQDSLSVSDFFRIANPFVAKIRCGHTKFMPWSKDFPFFYNVDKVFPCIVRFDNNGRLLIIKSSKKELIGQYIKEINSQPIDKIITDLKSQMMVDAYVRSSAPAQIEQYFSAWYGDFIQDSDQFNVTVSTENGQKKQIHLAGISSADWMILNKNIGYLKTKNSLEIIRDSIAHLRIPVFYSLQGNKHFLNFLDSSFTQIHVKKIKHLIIDVRDNEGGNDILGKELFAHIAQKDFRYYDRIEVKVKSKKQVPDYKSAYFPKFIGLAKLFIKKDKNGKFLFKKHKNLGIHEPKKNAFAGKVWFLINGLSYSVTSEFLAVAKSENRGIFVGTESGGTYEGDNSGTFVIFKLPATKLDLGLPVAGYYSAVKPAIKIGRGVMPDIEILPGKTDLLENRDSVLQVVLEEINRNDH